MGTDSDELVHARHSRPGVAETVNAEARQYDLVPGNLLRELRRRVRWVAGTILLSTVIFVAVAFLSTPVYRSTVVVVPMNFGKEAGAQSLLNDLGGLASLADINIGQRDSATEEALAVLQSRSFLQTFITDHQLLPQLFASKYDAHAPNGGWGSHKVPTLAQGVRYFKDNVLSISRDKKTGLIAVSVDWTNRQEASDWANDLIARVNAEMRSRTITTTAAYIDYLEKAREASPFVQTRDTINHLIEAQIRQRMIASVTHEYAFRVVDSALPADADDFVRPRRTLLIALGPVVGLLLCVLATLLFVRSPNDAS